jgi:proton glutamate symport protein
MRLRMPGLTTQILVALAAGAIVGWMWPETGRSLQVLATIFVRFVLVIIAPLIFSSLTIGIAGQGELRRLGGIALRAGAYFLAITAVALALGMMLALLLQPGLGLPAPERHAGDRFVPPSESFWVRIVPQSIFDAMARGDVLQIVLFSLVFGLAVALAGESGQPVRDWCGSLAKVMFKFTDLVMRAAPIGVFGAAAALVSRQGLAVGANILRLIFAVYAGLALLMLLVFPAVALLFRLPLRRLLHAVKEPFAIAFATSSASAALPKSMESMEIMGVPRPIVALVMPVGLSLNAAGTTVFAGVAALFILQAFAVPGDPAGLWTLAGALYLASKGVGGVPRVGLVVTAAGLAAVGVPEDVIGAGLGVLLGIDPILDMPRTAANVTGNCLAAAVIARRQGRFP